MDKVELSTEQTRQFLQAVETERLHALFHVAVRLGLREGELLDLLWADIDMEAGVLYVRQGKSSAAQRAMQLSTELVAVLKRHLEEQEREQTFQGARWHDTGRVFPSQVGTRLQVRSLTLHFRRALNAAGLPHIRFHDLRHTAISLWQIQGVDMVTWHEMAGHSNAGSTLRVYGHSDDERKRTAMERIEQLLCE